MVPVPDQCFGASAPMSLTLGFLLNVDSDRSELVMFLLSLSLLLVLFSEVLVIVSLS